MFFKGSSVDPILVGELVGGEKHENYPRDDGRANLTVENPVNWEGAFPRKITRIFNPNVEEYTAGLSSFGTKQTDSELLLSPFVIPGRYTIGTYANVGGGTNNRAYVPATYVPIPQTGG